MAALAPAAWAVVPGSGTWASSRRGAWPVSEALATAVGPVEATICAPKSAARLARSVGVAAPATGAEAALPAAAPFSAAAWASAAARIVARMAGSSASAAASCAAIVLAEIVPGSGVSSVTGVMPAREIPVVGIGIGIGIGIASAGMDAICVTTADETMSVASVPAVGLPGCGIRLLKSPMTVPESTTPLGAAGSTSPVTPGAAEPGVVDGVVGVVGTSQLRSIAIASGESGASSASVSEATTSSSAEVDSVVRLEAASDRLAARSALPARPGRSLALFSAVRNAWPLAGAEAERESLASRSDADGADRGVAGVIPRGDCIVKYVLPFRPTGCWRARAQRSG